MAKSAMLTTIDNPYDPFEEFDQWYKFDTSKGYNSSELIDRITYTSEVSPEYVTQAQINEAVDQVVSLNPNGMYKKIEKDY